MAISSILLFNLLSFVFVIESFFDVLRLILNVLRNCIDRESGITKHDSADDIHECWEIIFHKGFLYKVFGSVCLGPDSARSPRPVALFVTHSQVHDVALHPQQVQQVRYCLLCSGS